MNSLFKGEGRVRGKGEKGKRGRRGGGGALGVFTVLEVF